jgi:2-oxoglutarate dehydrogenase E1 component
MKGKVQSTDDNVIIANVTKASNIFHLMRRQLAWEFRKPCVVFSPKSLLRHVNAQSPIEEFTSGSFKEVYADIYATAKGVKRVLLCSGKVYFDLLEEQQKSKRKDVAVIRLEQLAPYPHTQLDAELNKYNKPEIFWVQEEPENMGAWSYVLRVSGLKLKVIARKVSASPATGYNKVHKLEQAAIVQKAFN